MNIIMLLAQYADGSHRVKTRGGGRAREVFTVSEASKVLKRTPRQIYRYLEEGTLEKIAKIGGEWWVDALSVRQLAQMPAQKQPLPKSLMPFFPENKFSSLNAGKHSSLILGTLLESGGIPELKWLFKRYSKESIRAYLEKQGAKQLTPRSFGLWKHYFNLALDQTPTQNPWEDRK